MVDWCTCFNDLQVSKMSEIILNEREMKGSRQNFFGGENYFILKYVTITAGVDLPFKALIQTQLRLQFSPFQKYLQYCQSQVF